MPLRRGFNSESNAQLHLKVYYGAKSLSDQNSVVVNRFQVSVGPSG